jgi:branched-chain amino acid aminotransferase
MTDDSRTIWKNGRLVPFAEATTHVMSHALHYGSSVFEGIRCYRTERGPRFLRLEDHVDRLLASARIYRMPVPFGRDQLIDACHEVVADNRLESAYVRPLLYRGHGRLGLDPGDTPTEAIVAAVEWDHYHGEGAKTDGVDACVVSWQRPAPNTLPQLAKAGGNYLSGQLIAAEAHRDGYAEGIALGTDGYVSEGSGMNVFVARGGVLFTPPASCSLLPGLTRDLVFELARGAGFEVREERIVRELLLLADELFLVGTAAEITPVRSVDRAPVGDGRPGPMTRRLQRAFAELVAGRIPDPRGHVTPLRRAEVHQ